MELFNIFVLFVSVLFISSGRLDLLKQHFTTAHVPLPRILNASLSPTSTLPGGPYDVIVASLALHVLVGHEKDSQTEQRYQQVLRSWKESLNDVS